MTKSKYPLIDEMNAGALIEHWPKVTLISLIDEMLVAHQETLNALFDTQALAERLRRQVEPPEPPDSRHEMGG